MDASNSGGVSIFMCKVCNLFSPSKAKLLTHVSEKHSLDGLDSDDIIVPLRPLAASQAEKSGEFPVKRKRGRPKGSTKKVCSDVVQDNTSGQKPSPEVQTRIAEEQENEVTGSLDCKKCNRKFCNKRQITKHICIIGLKEEGDEEDGTVNDPAVKLPAEGREEERERLPKRSRTGRPEKICSVKDLEQGGATKNPIISVVLTAHEAIPGATKIVPIEASPAEPAPTTEPEASGEAAGQKRGYQEYAIQQAAYEVPLKSNRLGQTQLKIFTCEYCNKVFKFKHSLQAHLRIHTNEKPFKCLQCDYASAIKANLSVHMRKHTGEKFSCEYCSFNCLSKGHLKVHVERVHKKVKQHCRFCKKKYSDVKNLLKHIRESHDMEDKNVKDSYEEFSLQTREGKRQLLYDCQICDRKFKNELDRDRHMMVHGTERPFGCELCDHGSTKYQALQVHIRKHPFVYVCSSCLQKFVSSVRLKAHLRDAHSDTEEAVAFAESINRSFCLLEPGSDIQRETLKQEELQITEELSLLNVQQHMLVPELSSSGEVTPAPSGAAVSMESHILMQNTGFVEVMESFPQEVCTTLVCDSQESKEHAMGEGTSEAAPEKVSHEDDRRENGVSYTEADSSVASSDVEKDKAAASHPQVNVELVQVTESSPQTRVSNGEVDVSSAPQEERTAFRQIIDGMQKRQLNMEVFERIRKVYGDLECEYCGKITVENYVNDLNCMLRN